MTCSIDTAPPPAIIRHLPTKSACNGSRNSSAPKGVMIAPAKVASHSSQSSSGTPSHSPADARSAAGSKANAETGQVTQNLDVRVFNVTSKQKAYRPKRATSSGRYYSLKPAPVKHFHLFVLAGVSPTSYTIANNSCDRATLTCTVDVDRKRVFDIGAGGSFTTGSGASIGIIGTVQGNIYGTLGFSF